MASYVVAGTLGVVVLTQRAERHHSKHQHAEREQEANPEHFQQRSATETGGNRFERDLDDVAQQRLVALALDLGMARAESGGLAIDVRVGESYGKPSSAQAVQDYLDEAERWLRKAANAGHHPAQLNLGLLLARRGGVAEAEHWLHEVATADSAELALRARQSLRDLHNGRASQDD